MGRGTENAAPRAHYVIVHDVRMRAPPDAADAVQRECSISDFTDAPAAWSQKVRWIDGASQVPCVVARHGVGSNSDQ